MRKYLLFSIIVLAALWVFSSNSAQAATINAASCSYVDVTTAIAAASAGDTVSVPSGSCTWASKLTITKGINLIGAGIGGTIITCTVSGTKIEYFPSNLALNTPFRFSGFTIDFNDPFRVDDPPAFYLYNGAGPPQTKIRVDHNLFKNAKTMFAVQGMFGVADNNTWDNNKCAWSNAYTVNYGLYIWENYADFVFGSTDNNFYYEDNIVTNSHDGLHGAQGGERFAVRYNTVTINGDSFPIMDMHGNYYYGVDSIWYSAVGAEMYGNNINQGAYDSNLFDQRGGKALWFNNNINATGSTLGGKVREERRDIESPLTNHPERIQHVNDTYIWNNMKNYTTRLDGDVYVSQDCCTGYSCDPNCSQSIDCCYNGTGQFSLQEDKQYWVYKASFNGTSGMGCGTLASRPATCTTGVGYWATNQSCNEITNYVGDINTNPTRQTISGTLYKCVNGSWTSYYTPLTYPHPLRSETPQTCTYTYSAWEACQPNNTQSRTVISLSPSGCTGTPILTQSCVYTNFLPEQYIQAENGTLSSPMQIGTDSAASGDKYVYSSTDNQGSVKFVFNIQTADQYKMEVLVNSNNDGGQNSFYLGLDSEAAQNNNYYAYSTPVIGGFVWDNVNRTGNGTTLPEFDPMIWDLSVGLHTFTFYGREANAWLDQIILKKSDTTPPAAPSGVVVN